MEIQFYAFRDRHRGKKELLLKRIPALKGVTEGYATFDDAQFYDEVPRGTRSVVSGQPATKAVSAKNNGNEALGFAGEEEKDFLMNCLIVANILSNDRDWFGDAEDLEWDEAWLLEAWDKVQKSSLLKRTSHAPLGHLCDIYEENDDEPDAMCVREGFARPLLPSSARGLRAGRERFLTGCRETEENSGAGGPPGDAMCVQELRCACPRPHAPARWRSRGTCPRAGKQERDTVQSLMRVPGRGAERQARPQEGAQWKNKILVVARIPCTDADFSSAAVLWQVRPTRRHA